MKGVFAGGLELVAGGHYIRRRQCPRRDQIVEGLPILAGELAEDRCNLAAQRGGEGVQDHLVAGDDAGDAIAAARYCRCSGSSESRSRRSCRIPGIHGERSGDESNRVELVMAVLPPSCRPVATGSFHDQRERKILIKNESGTELMVDSLSRSGVDIRSRDSDS